MRYRMLALDLDGTALDPAGRLGDGVFDAVGEVRASGVQVVLCTGRRFRTALPVARALSLSGPIVVNNGVVVKDLASGETLSHRYLPRRVRSGILALVREVGSPLAYVDAYREQIDILVEDRGEPHPFQREYLADNADFTRVVDDLAHTERDDVILLSTMGDESALRALRARAERDLGGRVRMHSLINKNYRGGILEFLAPGSGKWPALRRLAASRGVPAAQIAAVGDDDNDVEMLRGAGLGIAMGNAAPPVRAAADRVTGHNGEGGVVAAIAAVIDANRRAAS
jgi:Cof subfamily protein (haloacid dehalogenase superfamily)